MSRYRLTPTLEQEALLLEHCAHARFVWNLAVEQHSHWRSGRASAPDYHEQSRQLTEARAEFAWLRAGSQTVQQQALRDFHQLSRCTPGSRRRARVKIALARMNARLVNRRKDWVEKTSTALARGFDVIRVEDLRVGNMTRSAKGTVDLPGRQVRQKAGLNRRIMANAWGLLVTRLTEKAPGRVQKVNAAYTSQRCSSCGHVASESRKSQAGFRCVACGHSCNADVNAARNIAAGRAVTARGGGALAPPANREPQLPPPPDRVGGGLESHVLSA